MCEKLPILYWSKLTSPSSETDFLKRSYRAGYFLYVRLQPQQHQFSLGEILCVMPTGDISELTSIILQFSSSRIIVEVMLLETWFDKVIATGFRIRNLWASTTISKHSFPGTKPTSKKTELIKKLNEAIEREDFETAARLRDEIKTLI